MLPEELMILIQRNLKDLLSLEKERRGADRDELVFVGMANVSEYYWCAMKSLIRSRMEEEMFFGSYLVDRVSYSLELGYIDKLPRTPEKLLDIGDDITMDDIEKLLQERAEICEKEYDEVVAKLEGIRVDDLHDPRLKGKVLQFIRGERYPTIRWNFEWDNYVVVGVPDGITDSFVYEFKTTGSRYLFYYIRPVASTQADLYGYFFRRDRKRVQIYIIKEGKTETLEGNIDENNALKVLGNFKKVDEGGRPPLPKQWKCKKCEFRDFCLLYK